MENALIESKIKLYVPRASNTNNKDEKVTEKGKENEISNRKEENNITDVSCR